MNEYFRQELLRQAVERECLRPGITTVFEETGRSLQAQGIVGEMEVQQGHNTHAFYRLMRKPSEVIHVQGYLGMSCDQLMHVWARLMDYEHMMSLRLRADISIGNEHEAVTMLFPNFEMGVNVIYDAGFLEKMLVENLDV